MSADPLCDRRLLPGPTGTGKTHLSKFVLDRVWKEDLAVETAYVDCWEHHSTHAMYRELLEPFGDRVNTSPATLQRHYDFPTLDEQYRERRADLVDQLRLDDEPTDDIQNHDTE